MGILISGLTQHFFQDNRCSLGRNNRCISIHSVSPEGTMPLPGVNLEGLLCKRVTLARENICMLPSQSGLGGEWISGSEAPCTSPYLGLPSCGEWVSGIAPLLQSALDWSGRYLEQQGKNPLLTHSTRIPRLTRGHRILLGTRSQAKKQTLLAPHLTLCP